MYIAQRLRQLREAKKLSQGDIEKRTGLLRCYISRVENGHTVPSIETLEKLARALQVPVYQLFYGEQESSAIEDLKQNQNGALDWASNGRGRRLFLKLRHALARASSRDRELLLVVAAKMASSVKSNSR